MLIHLLACKMYPWITNAFTSSEIITNVFAGNSDLRQYMDILALDLNSNSTKHTISFGMSQSLAQEW